MINVLTKNTYFIIIIYLIISIILLIFISICFLIFLEWNIKESYYQIRKILLIVTTNSILIIIYIIINIENLEINYILFNSINISITLLFSIINHIYPYLIRLIIEKIKENSNESDNDIFYVRNCLEMNYNASNTKSNTNSSTNYSNSDSSKKITQKILNLHYVTENNATLSSSN